DGLRERHDDLVWRVRFGDQWLYVYLLLEFQATEDRFMALRIMVYLGLLYQDLVKSKQLTENDRLPPVLPLVLYNGEPRWSAPVDIGDLIEKNPGSLGRYTPRLSYLLIDEGAFSSEELGTLENFVTSLFKLEKSQSKENLLQVVTNLVKLFEDPERASLHRAFTVWINRVLVPRRSKQPAFENIEEVGIMLSERIKEWNKKWIDEGLAKGREEGLEQGLRRGRAEVLLTQLEEKFGVLPDDVRGRVEAGSDAHLREWSKRILYASQLGDVLNETN
ncbi:MAG: transposase, partial [Deltaproteobacteria bacterium]|nr:transposase [Deltaproteobacteria bacterium]